MVTIMTVRSHVYDLICKLQFANSVVCDTSKGRLYKHIEPPLVEVIVCKTAHVTNGGSGGKR